MKLAAKITLGISLYVAAAPCSSAIARDLPATTKASAPHDDWHDLAVISHEVCKTPDAYGYVRDASGRLGGHLDFKALMARIAGAGVNAEIKAGGRDWGGLLQSDFARALIASNDCARQVFQTMTQSLSVKPQGSAKALTPPRPQTITRIVQSAAPLQANTGNSGQSIQNVNSPSTNNQAGPISSSGQTGGFTGNLFLTNPPATEQEQAVAAYRLKLELSDLAQFPERARKDAAGTNLQSLLISNVAPNLYEILSRYYRPTIEAQQFNPLGLWKFRVDFYNAYRAEVALEDKLLMAFGETPTAATQEARIELFKYSVMREDGQSIDSLKKQPQFMIFMNFERAEAAYQQIIVRKSDHAGLGAALRQQVELNSQAQSLLVPYSN